MVFAEACHGSQFFNSNFFSAMLVDILAYIKKFINILMLFVPSDGGAASFKPYAVSSYYYKEIQE